MDIKIPATIRTPGVPEPTWKGTVERGPDIISESEVTLHIDAETEELLSGMFGGTPPEHLSAAALAAKYTFQELLAAMTIAAAPK